MPNVRRSAPDTAPTKPEPRTEEVLVLDMSLEPDTWEQHLTGYWTTSLGTQAPHFIPGCLSENHAHIQLINASNTRKDQLKQESLIRNKAFLKPAQLGKSEICQHTLLSLSTLTQPAPKTTHPLLPENGIATHNHQYPNAKVWVITSETERLFLKHVNISTKKPMPHNGFVQDIHATDLVLYDTTANPHRLAKIVTHLGTHKHLYSLPTLPISTASTPNYGLNPLYADTIGTPIKHVYSLSSTKSFSSETTLHKWDAPPQTSKCMASRYIF